MNNAPKRTLTSRVLVLALGWFSISPVIAQQNLIDRELDRATAEANDSKVLDETGKITRLRFGYFSSSQTFQLGYTADTLSTVTLESGTEVRVLRDGDGQPEGISFQNGAKVLYSPDGLRFINPSGEEFIFSTENEFNACAPVKGKKRQGFVKAALMLDPVRDCRVAVYMAGAAWANAGLSCAVQSPMCITAIVIAVGATAQAVNVCSRIEQVLEFPVARRIGAAASSKA